MSASRHILVIKLSALGDFVQAMGPFAAIRRHHPDCQITLLTTRPLVELARASPYFDHIWVDHRPKPWDVPGLIRLRKLLRSARFAMVYDLQTSERSSSYYHMMGEPPWSGIAFGCKFPHANPARDSMHTLDRQAEQLRMAGIPETPPPDLGWIERDLAPMKLPLRFMLMAPGGALHRPGKRWPAAHFAALANHWRKRELVTVLIGGEHDREPIDAILRACPTAMTVETSLLDIPAIARKALGAVGNDTGPMHLIAAAQCRSLVLFSNESNPALCAPRGRVTILQRDDLAQLGADEVIAAMDSL